jgi:hypothetical protein
VGVLLRHARQRRLHVGLLRAGLLLRRLLLLLRHSAFG